MVKTSYGSFQSQLVLHPESHVTTRTSVISLGEALSNADNITLTCALVQRGNQGGKTEIHAIPENI